MPRNSLAASSSKFCLPVAPRASWDRRSPYRRSRRHSRATDCVRLRSSSRPAPYRIVTGVRLKYVSYFTMLFALLCLFAFLAGNTNLPA